VDNTPDRIQGTNISHLGKRKIVFKHALGGDMLECKLNIALERWQCEVQDYFRNVMDLIFKAYHLMTFIRGAVAGKSTFRDFLSVKMTVLGTK